MALSYSGIVNYGKVTLPAVNSWYTDSNIIKAPYQSVHTRKIDKVGETSFLNSMIDESNDRSCEAINYYARGQNPMVSVSYGEAGQNQLGGAIHSGESFLPYRVVRDGAFRPPIWRQEDLLPLSRLPRVWTNVSTQPYSPIFTMRIKNCGTAEDTKEVKQELLKTACITGRTIAAEPNINAPDKIPTLIRDPLVPGEITANASCSQNNIDYTRKQTQTPILLAPTREYTSGWTNPHMIKEIPIIDNHVLTPTRAFISRTTNPNMIKESPITMNNVQLNLNHPNASAMTNLAAPSLSGYNSRRESVNFERLTPTRAFISRTTNPNMIKESPITMNNNVQLNLNHPNASAMTNFAAPSLSGYNPYRESVNFERLVDKPSRGGFVNSGTIPVF